MQLSYAKVDFDAFADRFGALVSLDNADSLLGRLGLSLNHQRRWNDGSGIVRSDVYAIGNLHYEFLDGTRVDVAGTGFANANDRLWGSIGGGGTYSWANGRYSCSARSPIARAFRTRRTTTATRAPAACASSGEKRFRRPPHVLPIMPQKKPPRFLARAVAGCSWVCASDAERETPQTPTI